MVSKSIKISEKNYFWLLSMAAEMQKKYGRVVSFDETLNVLKGEEVGNKKISDLAGKWKMSDTEAKKFMKDIRKGWRKWKIPSV